MNDIECMKNREKHKELREWNKWEVGILCGLAVMAVIPVVIAARYSFFQADDFSHANAVGVFGRNILRLFAASLKYVKRMYFTWQGTYSAMFMQAFLSPLNGFGSVQLCIVMLLNLLLFMCALAMLFKAVSKCFNIEIYYMLSVLSICIIGIFGFTSWTEIFYWFSGAVSYSFPLSFCFIGIAVTLQTKSIRGCILASILLFLASGGTLEVAGAGCFILLGICVVKKMADIAEYRDYAVLGVAVIGAVINAAAPGNYVRHSLIDDTGLHLKTAVLGAICEVINTTEDLLCDTPFIIFILIALWIGVKVGGIKDNKNRRCVRTFIFLCIAEPVVTCFPVLLGYSGNSFPNRCKFVETVMIVISLVFIAIITGYILCDKIKSYLFTREMCIILLLFLIIMPNINAGWRLSESVPYHMWERIADDSYKNHYLKVNAIYDAIANDSNEDVFIYELPEDIPDFLNLNISEDMSDWINAAITSYYGKRSVQYVSDNVYEQSNGQKNIRISPTMFETDLDYVSIFKVNNTNQETEVLLMLAPLDKNMIISVQAGESGKVGVYIFEDAEGKRPIEQMEIDY